jgi:lipid-A-disaccharide synthase
VPLQCWRAGRTPALAACDVTLIASGTATLEAALFKRPMVIGYNMHPLSWQLMKRMAYQPWVGLPNILSRDFVVPELIQDDCTPRPWPTTPGWLDDAARERLQRASPTCTTCCASDTARCATDAIAQVLGCLSNWACEWVHARPGGRCRRGRARPAGRARWWPPR